MSDYDRFVEHPNVAALTRNALSVGFTTSPVRRQQLFALVPQETFKGPALYYKLGRFFASDTATENFTDIAKATNLDPVALVGLTAEDESYRPLHEHLVRLLSARQAAAQAAGEDVIRWAEAISKVSEISEAAPAECVEKRPLFICAAELINRTTKINRLVGKTIQRSWTGQLFGPSGEGKTFVAMGMAFAVGTAGEWNGNNCEEGIVVYFNGEGHTGAESRLKALHKQHGCPDMSNIHISQSMINMDAKSIRQVIIEVRSIEETINQKVALIVIDTLARHIEGDENDTQAMNEFVKAIDGLREAFPGSSAIIIHHTGHSNGNKHRSRGSSALKAAMDFEILCDRGTLTFTKMKDGAIPERVEFKLVPVEIGTDEDGDPITSCFVKYGGRPASQKAATLTPFETLALDALITVCIAENRMENQQYSGDLELWRQEFYRLRRIEDNSLPTATLKKSFQTVLGITNRGGGLKEKGFVGFVEGRGAIPLRAADQDRIFNTILTSGKREQGGNSSHIRAAGNGNTL